MSISAARDERPFQLWADLRCHSLKDRPYLDPISSAAHEAKEREKQDAQGIVRLSECRRVD